jgi:hypothetical protein
MSGVATYNRETNTVEFAVNSTIQSGYKGFVTTVNAYGDRPWEVGTQFEGVARKDERHNNLAQEAIAAVGTEITQTENINKGLNVVDPNSRGSARVV